MKQCRLTGILRIEIRIATILRPVRRFSPNGMPQDYLWLSVGSVGIFDFPELNGGRYSWAERMAARVQPTA